MRLFLATHNLHKLREFQRILPGYELIAIPDQLKLPPETGETYAENALIKARAGASALGDLVIADDSGIEVQSLGGRPGIYSARYAGEQASDGQNLAKLMHEASPGSRARYVCAVALVNKDGLEIVFEGTCEGHLASQSKGGKGFGYDPVFLPDEGPKGLTMAQLSDDEKDRISHRGAAARKLDQWLASNA